MKRFLLALTVVASSLSAQITLVQHAWHGHTGTGQTKDTVVLPSNPTATHSILVCSTAIANSVFPTVTDKIGNTWSRDDSGSVNAGTSSMFYSSTVNSTTAVDTFVLTWASAVTYSFNEVAEFSGTKTSGIPDVFAAYDTGTSTTPTTHSITPTQNGDVLLGCAQNVSGQTFGTPSGWSPLDSATTQSSLADYMVQATAASVTWSPTVSGSAFWQTLLGSYFKASGGGGSTTGGCLPWLIRRMCSP